MYSFSLLAFQHIFKFSVNNSKQKNLLGTSLKFPTDIQRILVSRKAA